MKHNEENKVAEELLKKRLDKISSLESNLEKHITKQYTPVFSENMEEEMPLDGYDLPDAVVAEIVASRMQLMSSIIDFIGTDILDEIDDIEQSYEYKNCLGQSEGSFTKLKLGQSIAKYCGYCDPHWIECVVDMGKWYQNNIHTYQANKGKKDNPREWYKCPLLKKDKKVADDCTGYVSACLDLYHQRYKNDVDVEVGSYGSAEFGPDGRASKVLKSLGFKYFKLNGSDVEKNPEKYVRKGDILAVREEENGILIGQHHGEIYFGKVDGELKSYSWGNVHDGLNGHQGMPSKYTRYRYVHCWRKM